MKSAETPLRLGIVGCGGAAQTIHLPVLSTLMGQFEVVAVADEREQHAETAARRFGIPHRFTSAEALLRSVTVDALAVLTPSHEESIRLAIQHRVHVFSEKPISLDVDCSSSLCAQAAAAGLIFEVGLMRLHDRALNAAAKYAELGRPTAAQFMKCDGSDAAFRGRLLPDSVSLYTFGQVPSPKLPRGLSERQGCVLKQLLWSGFHLLTALVSLFPQATPRSGLLAADGSVYCMFTGPAGEVLQFSLLTTSVPVYTELIRLVAPGQIVTIEFDSPYRHPGHSRLTVCEGVDSPVSTRQDFDESAFQRMWDSFCQRLKRQMRDEEILDSSATSRRVEALALDIARLA